MVSHITRKKHKDFRRISGSPSLAHTTPAPMPAPTTPAPPTTPPPPTTPIGKMKGKTYLNKNCKDALVIDTTPKTHWARTFEITTDDLYRFTANEPNKFIMYYFMKLVKTHGRNMMPFRCTDINRKKFYYHDKDLGWVEDLCNTEIYKCIKMVFNIVVLAANKHFRAGGWDNDDDEEGSTIPTGNKMNLSQLNEIIVKNMFWGEARPSNDSYYAKSQTGADREKNEALEFLGELLRCGDDNDEDSS